jgi:hypothetical protein
LKLRNWNVGNNASAILTAPHDVMTVTGRSFSMILATASGVIGSIQVASARRHLRGPHQARRSGEGPAHAGRPHRYRGDF